MCCSVEWYISGLGLKVLNLITRYVRASTIVPSSLPFSYVNFNFNLNFDTTLESIGINRRFARPYLIPRHRRHCECKRESIIKHELEEGIGKRCWDRERGIGKRRRKGSDGNGERWRPNRFLRENKRGDKRIKSEIGWRDWHNDRGEMGIGGEKKKGDQIEKKRI